ncbi:cytochrome P450 [Aspergillus mulundensis]|uniref:Cytochrome P450 n=1 Tax=Aspergillus mulundensis TaxID=1810919 RepID=A0A3D8T3C6_9EURO|nr:Uncharacterized protein DSM5745_00362 [Aspergillus mulundensis]RDW93040.1 Uncharacterized protein DSM5745_00362 [Aspergillus mulundensis]
MPLLAVALFTIIPWALYFNISSSAARDAHKVTEIPTVTRPRLLDAYRSGVWWRIFLPRLVPYLEEGYYKYCKNGQPFRIWLSGFQDYAYILPEKYLERIKNAPPTEVSFTAVVNTVSLHSSDRPAKHGPDKQQYFYVGLPTGEINNLIVQVVSKLMNSNLATIKPIVHGATAKALDRSIGRPPHWKKINAFELALKTAQGPGARILYGETLSNNAGFVAGVSRYVANILAYAFTLRFISFGPLKNTILYLIHWRHRRSLPAVVTPLNDEIAERKRRQASGLADDEKPFDCVQWAMDQDVPEEDKKGEDIARRLVAVAAGSIETLASVLVKLLVQLAAHPECHAEIRGEIVQCLGEENDGWTVKATGRMRRLESFIQEALRVTAGVMAMTGLRVVTADNFRLDRDIVLPRNALLAFPTRSILHDAEIFPEPETFDAFRFYKIAKAKEENASGDLRSTHRDLRAGWLQFGYGRQSCPGRFYAINVMKTILGEIILRYEIRLAGGAAPPAAVDIDIDPLLPPIRSFDLELRARS